MEFLEITSKDVKFDAETMSKFHIMDDELLGLIHENTILCTGNFVIKLASGRTFAVPNKETKDELLDNDRISNLEKRIKDLEQSKYDWPWWWSYKGTNDKDSIGRIYVSDEQTSE